MFFSHIFGVGAFGYKMWTGGTNCFVIHFHIFGEGTVCVHCNLDAGDFCCLSSSWPDSRPHPYARPAVFSVLALKSKFLP